jgi:surface antigen
VLIALLSFLAATLVAGSLAAAPAQAASSLLCSGYASCQRAGYDHHGYQQNQRTSYWNMYGGTNCTNYVAYRLVTTNGVPNRRPWSGSGNARDWGTAMASRTDSTPAVGAVAWWGRSGGNHVAYVERVASPTEIIVSESNWGRDFDHRRITKSGSGWPDGFIHVKDTASTPRFTRTARPTFTGTERVGGVLTAKTAAWQPAASLRYQWYVGGAAIRGATRSTYRVRAADLGRALHVVVRGSRTGYPTKVLASARTTREIVPGEFTESARPDVTGRARVGSVLTATTPDWTPAATIAYQWYADDRRISGADEATYTLPAGQLGRRITVVATASRPGYTTQALESERQTEPVARGTFDTVPAPTVGGTPAVGSTLTADAPAWTPAARLAYQWYADGAPVEGATAATLALQPADLGKRLHVVVTGTRSGFESRTAASDPTTAVVAGRFTTSPRPVLTGTARVGSLLRARTAAWSPDAVLTYQWYRNGKAISGATGTSHRLTSADRGKRIHVVVTGTRDGYVTTRLASERTTDAVAAARG